MNNRNDLKNNNLRILEPGSKLSSAPVDDMRAATSSNLATKLFSRPILFSATLAIALILGALPSDLTRAVKRASVNEAHAQLLGGGGGGPMNIAQSIGSLMMLFQIIQKTNTLEGKQRERSRDSMINLSNSVSDSSSGSKIPATAGDIRRVEELLTGQKNPGR
jgi:hypothetical protein